MEFFSPHHLIELLHTYGYSVLAIVIGLECVGLPLPGETVLIASAVLAGTTHQLNIGLVVLFASLGAIIGQAAGYWIGWGVGFRLLRRYGHYIGLTNRRLAFGRALFRRHGVKVIIVSRFVVLLRTIAGLLAGANHMPWPRFMAANVVGSVVWAGLYGFGAYALGHEAKHVAGPVGIAIGVIAVAALLVAWLYVRRQEHALLRGRKKIPRSAGNNSMVTTK
ncbi:MAG TPA: DedA family protein [Acetobacteraceae bacterium]|jgi:membrane protein DedA with SNARE-associated domain|nr:DedA family protein [Acetobacteraceae bacterium]